MNIKVFLTLCLCLTCFSFLFSQNLSVSDTIQVRWDTLKQPGRGPNASYYFQHGNNLYAIDPIPTDVITYNENSTRKSTDMGKTWSGRDEYKVEITNNYASFKLETALIGEYKKLPNNKWGANLRVSILKSTNGGQTNSITYSKDIYVECFTHGGYCSNGRFRLENGIRDSTILFIYREGLETAPNDTLISTDLGITWAAYKGMYYNRISNQTAWLIKDSVIYYTQEKDIIFKGDSINMASLKKRFYAGSPLILKDSTFIIVDANIVYTTTNKGKTWSIDTLPFKVERLVRVNNDILIFTDTGIFKMQDFLFKNALKIYPISTIPESYSTGFSVLPSGWYLNSFKGELLRSTDRGGSWQLVNNTDGGLNMNNLYILDDSIVVKTRRGFMFEGKDFTKMEYRSPIKELTYSETFLFKRGNAYFKRSGSDTYRSLDYGQTWSIINFSFLDNPNGVLKYDSTRIYSANGRSIRISYDNGATVILKTINGSVIDLVFVGKTAYCLLFSSVRQKYAVFKSEDEATTWTEVSVFDNFPHNGARLFNTKNKWFITTNDKVIYESKDGTKTWVKKNTQVNYENVRQYGKHTILLSQSSRELLITADDGLSWTRSFLGWGFNYKFSDHYLYAEYDERAFFVQGYDQYMLRIHLDTLVSRVAALENYGILRGRIFKDSNNNCQQDTSENTGIENKIVHISPRNFVAVTDSKGQFEIALPPDIYTISTDNMPYFTRSCSNDTLHFTLKDKETIDTSLVFKKLATVYDLSLSLSSGSRARPGDEMVFVLKVDNKGTEDIDSAKITLSFPSQYVSWVSANPSMNQQNGILTAQLKNFKAGTSQTYEMTLKNATNTPLSTALIFKADGQILNKKDTVLKDNTDSLQLTVVGSFDPNDKTVLPEGLTPANIGELDYLIRFQNTGTDTAFKVVVVDTLPSNLDPLSIKSVVASHAYKISIKGNILTFTFDKIFLPDSFVNEKASHGFVRFKIRPQKWVYEGSSIANKAAIYFDYNEPVITNTALNQLVHPVFFIEQHEAICEGESFRGKIYRTNAFVYDTTRSWQEDTIRVTQIIVIPVVKVYKDTVLKATDTFLNKTWADKDKVEVRYKTSNGCDSIVYYTLHLLKTGLNDINSELNFVAIYPNPTRDIISIDYSLIKITGVRVILYNMIGQKLKILENNNRPTEGVHHLSEDVKNLPEGTYQISIETDKGVVSKRFVKQ